MRVASAALLAVLFLCSLAGAYAAGIKSLSVRLARDRVVRAKVMSNHTVNGHRVAPRTAALFVLVQNHEREIRALTKRIRALEMERIRRQRPPKPSVSGAGAPQTTKED